MTKMWHMVKNFDGWQILIKKIDFGEKYVFGQIFNQIWKIVIFGNFGDMCHCGLPGSQAVGMIWMK